jgi:hypothetical protein
MKQSESQKHCYRKSNISKAKLQADQLGLLLSGGDHEPMNNYYAKSTPLSENEIELQSTTKYSRTAYLSVI